MSDAPRTAREARFAREGAPPPAPELETAPELPELVDGPSPEETLAKLEAERLAAERKASHDRAAHVAGELTDAPEVARLIHAKMLEDRTQLRMAHAVRLLAAWTVGKPENADDTLIAQAAVTVALLEHEIRKNETD